jgi:small-conductance mechanosensitive channel
MIEHVFEKSIRIALILCVVFVSAKFIHWVSEKIVEAAKKKDTSVEREKRLATVVGLIDTLFRILLFGAAFLMVLKEFGVDISPLLTGAGIAGVALGLGAQSIVKDILAGVFFLIEDQIRIGDVIKINSSLSGTVERMELRVTALRDGDGTLHIVPNGEIKSVSNMTYEFSQALVDLPIPVSVEMNKALSIIQKVVQEFKLDSEWGREVRDGVDLLGVQSIKPGFYTVQISAKTGAHARWKVARELRRRLLHSFNSENISLDVISKNGK